MRRIVFDSIVAAITVGLVAIGVHVGYNHAMSQVGPAAASPGYYDQGPQPGVCPGQCPGCCPPERCGPGCCPQAPPEKYPDIRDTGSTVACPNCKAVFDVPLDSPFGDNIPGDDEIILPDIGELSPEEAERLRALGRKILGREVPAEQRVDYLPDDAAGWHTTVVLRPAWEQLEPDRSIEALIRSDPRMARLAEQTRLHVYLTSDPMFAERLAAYIPAVPAFIVQDGGGQVIFSATGETVDVQAIPAGLEQSLEQYCPGGRCPTPREPVPRDPPRIRPPGRGGVPNININSPQPGAEKKGWVNQFLDDIGPVQIVIIGVVGWLFFRKR